MKRRERFERKERQDLPLATVQVRSIVSDADGAIAFYTHQLDFHLIMRPAPPFEMLSRGNLR